MLSRVTDAVYWLNRYIGQAKNIAHFLPTGLLSQWDLLVSTTENLPFFFQEHYGTATAENVIRFLAFDPVRGKPRRTATAQANRAGQDSADSAAVLGV